MNAAYRQIYDESFLIISEHWRRMNKAQVDNQQAQLKQLMEIYVNTEKALEIRHERYLQSLVCKMKNFVKVFEELSEIQSKKHSLEQTLCCSENHEPIEEEENND